MGMVAFSFARPGKLRELLVLGVLLLAGVAEGAGFPAEIIPEGHRWTVNRRVGGETRRFVFPDAYAQLDSLPAVERRQILDEARRIERNIEHVRQVGREFFGGSQPAGLQMILERELGLREVVVAVREPGEAPLERHWPILDALPKYSRVHVIAPRDSVDMVQRELLGRRMLARSVVHPVDVGTEPVGAGFVAHRPSRWVRDTFIPGKDAQGHPVTFLPLAYAGISDLTRSDLDYFESLSYPKARVVRLPVFVRGGNVLLAAAGKEKILFVGEREFRHNAEVFLATTGFRPPDELLTDVLKRVSGADRIVVLPNSDHLFHLDMVMSLPRPGVVALVAPTDPEKLEASDREVIARVRAEIGALRLRIVDVPTTAARIAAFQSVVNVVPFRNASSGRRSVLLPEYPDQAVNRRGRSVSLNALVRAAFGRTGVRPIPLEERFFSNNGNTHCVIVGVT